MIPTSQYPHLHFPFEEFNPVQSEAFEFYHQDCNAVVAAATSAGKTCIAEMFMGESIFAGKKKAIFLSPLKAVSQEKSDDWNDMMHGFGQLNVSIVTGDYQLTPARCAELNAAHVIVMTSEMLDSRTRRIESENNKWLAQVGTLVVDEAHLLTMKGRGDKLESALMRFTRLVPGSRVVLLSATMPNVSQLAEWLTSLNGKKTELINSSYRPCELGIHYLEYRSKEFAYHYNERNKIDLAMSLMLDKHPQDKFICFVHSKKNGHQILKMLKKKKVNAEFHYADIGLQDRRRLETSFKQRQGGVRILVATSTLAWGVNMPARRVVVVGVTRGLEDVHPYDVKQMVGRAGRVGWDPRGDSYVLLPRHSSSRYIDCLENMPGIESQMIDEDVFAFHAISEVGEGTIWDATSLQTWHGRSFAKLQDKPMKVEESQQLLDKMERCRVIRKTDMGRLIPTGIGKVASWLYLSPWDCASWYEAFNEVFKRDQSGEINADEPEVISAAMSDCPSEIADYVPKGITLPIQEYARLLSQTGLRTQGPIAGLAYFNRLTDQPELRDIAAKERGLVRDLDRIITALKLIDTKYAHWGREDWFDMVGLRIKYKVPTDVADLCRLNQVGGVRARQMYDAGISSIVEFLAWPDEAQAALGSGGARIYSQAKPSAIQIVRSRGQLAEVEALRDEVPVEREEKIGGIYLPPPSK